MIVVTDSAIQVKMAQIINKLISPADLRIAPEKGHCRGIYLLPENASKMTQLPSPWELRNCILVCTLSGTIPFEMLLNRIACVACSRASFVH